MKLIKFLLLIAFTVIALASCASSVKIDTTNLEELFKVAKERFVSKDYLESTKYFEIIKLQFPASQYSDDAQFYLAEIEFEKERYIYASFNYSLLRKYYPNSDYAKLSLFKSALSLFKQSPKFDRDQDYTRKALSAMMEFQSIYPKDSLAQEANKFIGELRNKLAEREYATAELYRKMEQPKSSLIYYDQILSDYEDTKYYEPAYFGKIEILVRIRKYDEALGLCDLYIKIFPQGENLSEVLKLKETATAANLKAKK